MGGFPFSLFYWIWCVLSSAANPAQAVPFSPLMRAVTAWDGSAKHNLKFLEKGNIYLRIMEKPNIFLSGALSL